MAEFLTIELLTFNCRQMRYCTRHIYAGMAELADALDLGSSVNRRAGSTPVIRIFFKADALLCVSAFFDLENIRLWCTIKKTCPERRPIWQSMY